MSRSYKKIPGSNTTNAKQKKFWLRQMNKRIRNSDLYIPEGNVYRRFQDRWNYRDYNWRIFTKRKLEESWYFEEDVVYKVYIK